MKIKQGEKGQSIVLIVISLVGLIAMAALIVDGGNAYLNRRNAQTAADAAVLAAAYEKCVLNTPDLDLQTIVDEYAVTQNGADSATYSVDYPSGYFKGRISVETTIIEKTFFAKVFNQPTVTVKADAAAGCFLPASAENIIPVAWTCRQAVGGSTNDCFIKKIQHSDWNAIVATLGKDWFKTKPASASDPLHLLDDGTHGSPSTYYDNSGGPMIYLVMDDDSFDMSLCQEAGLGGIINCDFDDDGYYDIEGGADRGWLYLDGVGSSDLSTIMRTGYPDVLELPQWFPGKSGVSASVFDAAEDIKFRISLLPVFNALCEDTYDHSLTTDCPTEYQTGDLIAQTAGSAGSQPFYRVPGVAAFVITCVSKVTSDYCPGKELAGLKHNVSTIEGYFIEGFSTNAQIGQGGFDLGVYVLSLTE